MGPHLVIRHRGGNFVPQNGKGASPVGSAIHHSTPVAHSVDAYSAGIGSGEGLVCSGCS